MLYALIAIYLILTLLTLYVLGRAAKIGDEQTRNAILREKERNDPTNFANFYEIAFGKPLPEYAKEFVKHKIDKINRKETDL